MRGSPRSQDRLVGPRTPQWPAGYEARRPVSPISFPCRRGSSRVMGDGSLSAPRPCSGARRSAQPRRRRRGSNSSLIPGAHVGALWILSHASLRCTGCMRLRHMRRFTRSPVCGTRTHSRALDLLGSRRSLHVHGVSQHRLAAATRLAPPRQSPRPRWPCDPATVRRRSVRLPAFRPRCPRGPRRTANR